MGNPDPAPETRATTPTPGRIGRWMGLGSVVGVGVGVLAGVVAAANAGDPGGVWLRGADATILAWTNAFRLVVPPLVVSQLFLAIAERKMDKRGAARLGWLVPSVFAALLVVTALIAITVTLAAMTLPLLSGLTLQPPGGSPAPGPNAAPSGDLAWVNDVIPPNLVAAAGSDNILPLMLFTLVFALAARRLAPELQDTLRRGFEAVRGATFILVDWTMLAAPVVLFALAFRSAFASGLSIGGVLLAFALLSLVVHAIAILAMYPVGVLVGGVGLGRFARAAYQPQLVAASTRSSLATLPSLLAVTESVLRVPAAVASLVIPIGGAVLKLSRAVSSPVKFLFLAAVLGISLDAGKIAVFTATILLLSPSTPGVPRVLSGTRSLPAYVSAGIPPEYVILLGATNAITDVLMTVLNTTGYLVATVVVGRFALVPASGLAAGQPVRR